MRRLLQKQIALFRPITRDKVRDLSIDSTVGLSLRRPSPVGILGRAMKRSYFGFKGSGVCSAVIYAVTMVYHGGAGTSHPELRIGTMAMARIVALAARR